MDLRVKDSTSNKSSAGPTLVDIFLSFLKIGSISFGGFIAMMAVIEKEISLSKKWLSEKVILDGMTMASMLPGPMAVNLTAMVGFKLKGRWGALIAIVGVLLPSFCLVIILSYYYKNIDREFLDFFSLSAGLMISSLILSVGLKMLKKNTEHFRDYVFVFVLFFTYWISFIQLGHYATITALVLAAFWGYLNASDQSPTDFSNKSLNRSFLIVLLVVALIFILYTVSFSNEYLEFISAFSSLSLSLYGGGYVFIPLAEDLVIRKLEWMNSTEFYDAIAIGQITPGPIMISVAVIGYKLYGISGALLACLSFFTPPALVMIYLTNISDKLKASAKVLSAIKNTRLAVIAIVIFTAFHLFRQYVELDLSSETLVNFSLFILSFLTLHLSRAPIVLVMIAILSIKVSIG